MRRTVRKFFRKMGYDIIKFKKDKIGLYPYYDMRKFVNSKKPMLFDVGANLGQTVKDFNEAFTKATIHSFEPTLESFQTLKQKTSHIKDLHLWNYAVGSSEKEMYFNQYELSNTNSFFNIHENQSPKLKKKALVKTITIDNFIEQHQIKFIDVLKTDTEGFELEVLKGATNTIKNSKIGMLLLEIHFVQRHPDIPRFTELIDFALDFGFEIVSIYPVVHRKNMGAYTDVLFKHKDYAKSSVK